MYMCSWFTWLCSRSSCNIVKQPYSNKNKLKKKKERNQNTVGNGHGGHLKWTVSFFMQSRPSGKILKPDYSHSFWPVHKASRGSLWGKHTYPYLTECFAEARPGIHIFLASGVSDTLPYQAPVCIDCYPWLLCISCYPWMVLPFLTRGEEHILIEEEDGGWAEKDEAKVRGDISWFVSDQSDCMRECWEGNDV